MIRIYLNNLAKIPVNYKQVNLWHKNCIDNRLVWLCALEECCVAACEVANTGESGAARYDIDRRRVGSEGQTSLAKPWNSLLPLGSVAFCLRGYRSKQRRTNGCLKREYQTDYSGFSGIIQSPLRQCQKLKLTCQGPMQENRSACQENLISMGKITTVCPQDFLF